MTILCSKLFQVDIDRSSQSPYIVFNVQKSHDDEIVLKGQEFLWNNRRDKFSTEKLDGELAVCRRNPDCKFVKATGNMQMEYLQRVKIESVKKQLEISHKTVQEIMYEVGYSDLRVFHQVLRKVTRLSPIAYWSKHNKDAVKT